MGSDQMGAARSRLGTLGKNRILDRCAATLASPIGAGVETIKSSLDTIKFLAKLRCELAIIKRPAIDNRERISDQDVTGRIGSNKMLFDKNVPFSIDDRDRLVDHHVTGLVEDRNSFIDHEIALVVGDNRDVVDHHNTFTIDFKDIDGLDVFTDHRAVIVEDVFGNHNFVDEFNVVIGKPFRG